MHRPVALRPDSSRKVVIDNVNILETGRTIKGLVKKGLMCSGRADPATYTGSAEHIRCQNSCFGGADLSLADQDSIYIHRIHPSHKTLS
ncbi:hypothetical protein N7457_000876 [Penicillium paradoxum]|uniref:uncharacterized protein n=1 Tax=Penicillium paradoxum TaxID=176176 RepID=UPI00254697B9|nr:uncharacterized protein N7457_000876 [Penicillium paradoxum]KAJ5794277.1 hypothetical protein N7457_000876 [Penicillium paradoxum]